MKTISELALEVTDPVVLDAAKREADFFAWLLEEPETRIAAWIASSEEAN